MKYFSARRYRFYFFDFLSRILPVQAHKRYWFLKKAGVDIKGPCSVARDVLLDSIHPELITIEEGVRITPKCIVLTHFIDSSDKELKFRNKPVIIKKNAFLGVGTIICNSVTIGENAIVGAGSVVTKDIPANEVWAGNPAHFIKKRCDNL